MKDRFSQLDIESLQDPSPYIRSQQALKIGSSKDRTAFQLLLPLTFDSEHLVRKDALISLGQSQDSRAYFFLANYFFWAEEHFS